MKKFILIILSLFICSCSADYNLVIDNNYVYEDVSLTIPKSVVSETELERQYSFNKSVYGNYDSYYKKDIRDDAANYYLNYSFKHNIDKYRDSSFLKACYSSSDISIDTDIISIETNGNFNCIYRDDGVQIDEVKVNINTKLKVIDNNADVINGNDYTWIFNKDNYKNKNIVIKMEKSDNVAEKSSNSLFIFVLFVILICILSFVLFLVIRNKNIKNNSI